MDRLPEFVPEHFTNIQAGLRFACNYLRKHPAANKQIICITDGEPTAHLEGRELVLVYPPSERTARHTLAEVVGTTVRKLRRDKVPLPFAKKVESSGLSVEGTRQRSQRHASQRRSEGRAKSKPKTTQIT